jgi:hypothetical protein
MRTFIAATLATSLFATSVFASDLPLPAGKPAGVKTAQLSGDVVFLIIGGALVIGGVALIAGNNSQSPTPTPVTGTTGTAG